MHSPCITLPCPRAHAHTCLSATLPVHPCPLVCPPQAQVNTLFSSPISVPENMTVVFELSYDYTNSCECYTTKPSWWDNFTPAGTTYTYDK